MAGCSCEISHDRVHRFHRLFHQSCLILVVMGIVVIIIMMTMAMMMITMVCVLPLTDLSLYVISHQIFHMDATVLYHRSICCIWTCNTWLRYASSCTLPCLSLRAFSSCHTFALLVPSMTGRTRPAPSTVSLADMLGGFDAASAQPDDSGMSAGTELSKSSTSYQ